MEKSSVPNNRKPKAEKVGRVGWLEYHRNCDDARVTVQFRSRWLGHEVSLTALNESAVKHQKNVRAAVRLLKAVVTGNNAEVARCSMPEMVLFPTMHAGILAGQYVTLYIRRPADMFSSEFFSKVLEPAWITE